MNINELIDDRSVIRLRPVRERESAVVSYRVILNTLIREIRHEFNESVLPLFKAHRALQMDAESWFSRVRARAAAATERAIDKVSKLFYGESTSHLRRLWRSITQGTKIDFPEQELVNQVKEMSLIQNYVDKNTSLIKSVANDVIKRMEMAVYTAKADNWSATQLTEHLREQFKIDQRRAKVISVDQVVSLNSDLTLIRAQELSLDYYVWTTQRDERVRERHRRIDGKLYKWGYPTEAEMGMAPGRPINCRCSAALAVMGKNVKASQLTENQSATLGVQQQRASNG